jgi:hypothetical protein
VGLLVVLVLAVALFVVILLPMRLMSGNAAAREQVRNEAIESPAVVRRIWETGPAEGQGAGQGPGQGAGRDARVGMVVSVEPDAGEAFVAQLEETLPRPQIRGLRPGHVITVKYRPADPTHVVVVKLS